MTDEQKQASVQREAEQLIPEKRPEPPAMLGAVQVPSMYPANEWMLRRIKESFTYHAPRPGQPERYTALRLMAKDLAHAIVLCTPLGREQALALTKLEEAIMWANKGIALEPEGR